ARVGAAADAEGLCRLHQGRVRAHRRGRQGRGLEAAIAGISQGGLSAARSTWASPATRDPGNAQARCVPRLCPPCACTFAARAVSKFVGAMRFAYCALQATFAASSEG